MRVAVSQFATSSNVQENLATCIRMINETAVCKPSLIVLPEFCNTLSWYLDHNQAWNAALAIDGDFLQCIAAQAQKHDCYIVINVTIRRDDLREHQDATIKSNISVTSCLFSPLGELIHQQDKQTLVGHENDFFISASRSFTVVATTFGHTGLLSGNDSITFEGSRELALLGAQLLCNPLSSNVLDQSNLHGPARTYENKVFLATANKIGSVIPKEQATVQGDNFSAQCFVPQDDLVGASVGIGHSQIVAPNGNVLAKVTNNEEGFVFADINLAEAGISANHKCRPDGTELIKQRRPELYLGLTLAIKQADQHDVINSKVPVTANVAIFATYKTDQEAIEDVCHYIENNLSDIIQLPELFFIADKTITNNVEQRVQIERLSQQLINQVSLVLRPHQYVCTSLVIAGIHQAVLISEHGLFAIQDQLHFCKRYQWTPLGDDLTIIELPLEQGNITVAMLTADDANIPEIVKQTALNGIHLLLVPFDIQEAGEVEYSLLTRAAENRICIVAASREKSFVNDSPADNGNDNLYSKNKVKFKKSTGLIANLITDFALLPQWQSPKFNGFNNKPIVTHQHGKITKAVIHPIAACSKLMTTKQG
ncbi:nitrilase-related carbon-nitrogen hydrolase [Colwelliaceae bacterium BS250]